MKSIVYYADPSCNIALRCRRQHETPLYVAYGVIGAIKEAFILNHHNTIGTSTRVSLKSSTLTRRKEGMMEAMINRKKLERHLYSSVHAEVPNWANLNSY